MLKMSSITRAISVTLGLTSVINEALEWFSSDTELSREATSLLLLTVKEVEEIVGERNTVTWILVTSHMNAQLDKHLPQDAYKAVYFEYQRKINAECTGPET